MTEERILALAETRANLQDTSFEQAESEVRAMLAEGATYDPDHGWVWPTN